MSPSDFDVIGQVLGGAGLLLTCLAVLIPIAVLIAFFGMYSRLGRINNTLVRIEGQLIQQNAALAGKDTAVLPAADPALAQLLSTLSSSEQHLETIEYLLRAQGRPDQ